MALLDNNIQQLGPVDFSSLAMSVEKRDTNALVTDVATQAFKDQQNARLGFFGHTLPKTLCKTSVFLLPAAALGGAAWYYSDTLLSGKSILTLMGLGLANKAVSTTTGFNVRKMAFMATLLAYGYLGSNLADLSITWAKNAEEDSRISVEQHHALIKEHMIAIYKNVAEDLSSRLADCQSRPLELLRLQNEAISVRSNQSLITKALGDVGLSPSEALGVLHPLNVTIEQVLKQKVTLGSGEEQGPHNARLLTQIDISDLRKIILTPETEKTLESSNASTPSWTERFKRYAVPATATLAAAACATAALVIGLSAQETMQSNPDLNSVASVINHLELSETTEFMAPIMGTTALFAASAWVGKPMGDTRQQSLDDKALRMQSLRQEAVNQSRDVFTRVAVGSTQNPAQRELLRKRQPAVETALIARGFTKDEAAHILEPLDDLN
jgi:hypothetical protein